MKPANMADKCMCVLLLWVQLQFIAGKPLFGMLWCDLFCDDYDDLTTTTTTTTNPDYDVFDTLFDDPCSVCPTRSPTTPRVPNLAPAVPGWPGMPAGWPNMAGMPGPPFGPPFMNANGMNVTWTSNNGTWTMNFVPSGPGGGATPMPAPGQSTTAAPTTARPASAPAVPGATTAAPGATTAAPGATTAAPGAATTAAPAAATPAAAG